MKSSRDQVVLGMTRQRVICALVHQSQYSFQQGYLLELFTKPIEHYSFISLICADPVHEITLEPDKMGLPHAGEAIDRLPRVVDPRSEERRVGKECRL